MKIAYARVSTRQQNLDMQLEAFHKEGCEKIYQEKNPPSPIDPNSSAPWTTFAPATHYMSGRSIAWDERSLR
jgi:hypothetical protein